MESLSSYISRTLKQLDIGFEGSPIVGTISGVPHCALFFSSESFLSLIRYLSEDNNIYYELPRDLRHLISDNGFVSRYEEVFGDAQGQHWHYFCKTQDITYASLVFESSLVHEDQDFYRLCCRLGKDLVYAFFLKMQNDFIAAMEQGNVSSRQQALEGILFSNNPLRQRRLNQAAKAYLTKKPPHVSADDKGEAYDLSGMFTPEFMLKNRELNWLAVLDRLNGSA